jgi:hypothetical protein
MRSIACAWLKVKNEARCFDGCAPGIGAGCCGWNAQGFLAHTYRLMENNREAYAWYYATAKCGSQDARIELSMLEPKLSEATIEQGKKLGDVYHDRYCR